MKQYLLALVLLTMALKSQNPVIGTATILPNSPTINDQIKIVTKVTAPNMGTRVDILFQVTQNPKEIKLRTCFSDGMLPALQTYIDTFSIGQLPAGVYAIKHNAYMSSAQQHCNATDSSIAVLSLTVTAPSANGIKEIKDEIMTLSPNPVQNELYMPLLYSQAQIIIVNVSGQIVKTITISSPKIDVSDLPKGLYFVRIRNSEFESLARFIKD